MPAVFELAPGEPRGFRMGSGAPQATIDCADYEMSTPPSGLPRVAPVKRFGRVRCTPSWGEHSQNLGLCFAQAMHQLAGNRFRASAQNKAVASGLNLGANLGEAIERVVGSAHSIATSALVGFAGLHEKFHNRGRRSDKRNEGYGQKAGGPDDAGAGIRSRTAC